MKKQLKRYSIQFLILKYKFYIYETIQFAVIEDCSKEIDWTEIGDEDEEEECELEKTFQNEIFANTEFDLAEQISKLLLKNKHNIN